LPPGIFISSRLGKSGANLKRIHQQRTFANGKENIFNFRRRCKLSFFIFLISSDLQTDSPNARCVPLDAQHLVTHYTRRISRRFIGGHNTWRATRFSDFDACTGYSPAHLVI
jgi:hypothetical protein